MRVGVHSQWLGHIKYEDGLKQQQRAWEAVRAGGQGVILGCEHPPVITLGRRARESEEVLGQADIPVVVTDRGGQATMHLPGQLVIYPILDLRALGISVRDYIHLLHQATQNYLVQTHGIEAFEDAERGAGLYTVKGKIAFFGVRVDRGVTRHGLAINISNDLAPFALIRSCGYHGASLDRVIDARKTSLNSSLAAEFSSWLPGLLSVHAAYRNKAWQPRADFQ